MANPAAIHRYMPQEAIDRARHVQLLLTNSAVLFTSAAASVVIYATVINPSAVTPAHVFLGFVLFLLGVSLALLAPVADQFPAAVRIAVAVAVALRAYLFGGN